MAADEHDDQPLNGGIANVGAVVPAVAAVVAGLSGAVAARMRTPLSPRVLLHERQDAAPGSTRPQVSAGGPGQEVDGVGGQGTKDYIGASGGTEVPPGHRQRVALPPVTSPGVPRPRRCPAVGAGSVTPPSRVPARRAATSSTRTTSGCRAMTAATSTSSNLTPRCSIGRGGTISRSRSCARVSGRPWRTIHPTTTRSPGSDLRRPSLSMAYVLPTPGAVPRYVRNRPGSPFRSSCGGSLTAPSWRDRPSSARADDADRLPGRRPRAGGQHLGPLRQPDGQRRQPEPRRASA
jgi:hypothetical protein